MYKYEITPYILKLIKNIYKLSTELEDKKLSQVILYNLELDANSLSSYSSTSIEGNPLPLTEVKKIIKSHPTSVRDTEREVLQYNETLLWLNGLLKNGNFDLNEKMIIQIHRRLMKNLMPKVKLGSYRKEAVLVNNPKLRKPIFWPPDYQDVPKLMAHLIGFISKNKEEVDPLILAGLFHKQFVLIHPFLDGNGRTVRLATKTLLADLGVNTFYLFSFENFYNNNVTKYFDKVGEKGDYYEISKNLNFTEWLEYFCEGVLDELLRVQKNIHSLNTKPEPIRLNQFQQIILKHLDENDFITDSDYARLVNRSKAARTLDFKKLLTLNLIERREKGPATYYVRRLG